MRAAGHFHGRFEIGATKHDAGIRPGRQQRHVNLAPRMQANAARADCLLQGTLTDHVFALRSDSIKKARRPEEQLRSEEHTSELQYLMRNSYAVFSLKNKKIE